MSHENIAEDIELTDRDYYLLGRLTDVPRAKGGYRAKGRLPRGCTEDQATRLVRGGYLERVVFHAAGGQQTVRYVVTDKGRAAWRRYQFPAPPPKPKQT